MPTRSPSFEPASSCEVGHAAGVLLVSRGTQPPRRRMVEPRIQTMKVVVVGANGTIGSKVADALEAKGLAL